MRFARESRRSNPRLWMLETRRARARGQQDIEGVSYEEILGRVDEGISHLRHLTRTLRESAYAEGSWDEHFREQWAAIVRDAGHAIADPDTDVAPVHDRLNRLARTMSDEHGLPQETWPVYGSLLTSMRHIAVIVDDVASARSVREG
ncbi:hypothetical protein [Janibacter corallicola]|uniref:hypothetical protein n=1 Tax=Janibacter corallicola TaxID=415212 RepID=UPI001FE07B0B|nr:hypothetical protein [Janibacter corallicola]